MEVVLVILSLASFLFFGASLVGLISPKLVRQTSRGKAFGSYFALSIGATVLIAALAPDNKQLPPFSIVSDESKRDIKRTVLIALPERVDIKELEAIAQSLYRDGYQNTFISFRVDGQESGHYWATAHFTPELKVTIQGSTKEEHKQTKELAPVVNGEPLGTWLVNYGFEYKAVLYTQGDTYYIQNFFPSGQGEPELLEVTEVNGQTRYTTESGLDHQEYFIISPNGELQFWSENGNYYSAPATE